MRILGYGEDALTCWALAQHLPEVIGQPPLNDGSGVENSLLIYRPSFGRAGGNESAQSGEFDAIIGTAQAVYLVESKWTGEPIINGQVILAARQILRHQVFHWIRERWLQQNPPNWDHFYHHDHNSTDFSTQFQGKPLPPPRSRLSSNLEYVLRQLAAFPANVRDVLLYFRLEGGVVPNAVGGAPSFVVVPFTFHPLNPQHDGRVIDMRA